MTETNSKVSFSAIICLGDGAILKPNEPVPRGVSYSDKDHNFLISDASVQKVLASLERITKWFLDWSAANPYQFTLVIALLAFAAFMRYLGSRQNKRMEIDYKERRAISKMPELELRMPEPSSHKGERK